MEIFEQLIFLMDLKIFENEPEQCRRDLFSIWHLLSYAHANFLLPLIARRKKPWI